MGENQLLLPDEDQPGMKQEKGSEHFPEDSNAVDSSQSTVNSPHPTGHSSLPIASGTTADTQQQSSSDNMEVHKHPHHVTHKKKWGEYLLEFLMLFLAVFLGFITENIREGISENSKAKELAESLYKEVYADSVAMHAKIIMRLDKEERMQYLRRYILDSNLSELPEKFYPAFTSTAVLTTSIIFEPNDGILSQLRNSGALRYFKDTALQNCISRISVAIANARDRNGQEFNFIEDFMRPFVVKHFDFKWMDGYTQNAKLTILEALRQTDYHSQFKPVIKNMAQFNRQDAEGLIAYYLVILRATRQLHYQAYIEKNHELLQALRKEYGIK